MKLCEAHGIISPDIIRAEVRIGRPRDSMCEAHGIISPDIIRAEVRIGRPRDSIEQCQTEVQAKRLLAGGFAYMRGDRAKTREWALRLALEEEKE